MDQFGVWTKLGSCTGVKNGWSVARRTRICVRHTIQLLVTSLSPIFNKLGKSERVNQSVSAESY